MVEEIDKPHLITRPIQLLAAWLVGLSVINASFLGAAKLIGTATWECGALVIASIVNVPIFIFALFLLQTKFRPEMQEDSYYAQYIDKKTGTSVQLNKLEILESCINDLKSLSRGHVNNKNVREKSTWAVFRIAINDYLPFFEDLRIKLREENILVSIVFGKSSGNGKPPTHRVISFSSSVPSILVIELLKILVRFPFDGYMRHERIIGVDDADVYIGSYEKLEDYVPFSPNVIKSINEAAGEADLDSITTRYFIPANDPFQAYLAYRDLSNS